MSPLFYPRKKSTASRKGGFSIVELLVTITIFTVISTTMLFRYQTYSARLNLDTLVHEIALWVREAQVSAVSAKKNTGGLFVAGYGVHFQKSLPNSFFIFADINNSKRWDAGDTVERTVPLKRGFSIFALCGDGIGGAPGLCTLGTFKEYNYIDATFTRPNSDAALWGDTINPPATPVSPSPVHIIIRSANGNRRTIEVWPTGQISVK